MNRQRDQKTAQDEARTGFAAWDDDGGAARSEGGPKSETEREAIVEQSKRRSAFDASHESSDVRHRTRRPS